MGTDNRAWVRVKTSIGENFRFMHLKEYNGCDFCVQASVGETIGKEKVCMSSLSIWRKLMIGYQDKKFGDA